jgi:transposase-like protein
MTMDITRTDHSVDELLREACRCEDAKQARRLLGLAMALEGAASETIATAAGVSRQTLRNWVIRFNQYGIEGLKDKRKSVRPQQSIEAQLREFDAMVEKLKKRHDHHRRLRRRHVGPDAAGADTPDTDPSTSDAPALGNFAALTAAVTSGLPEHAGDNTARNPPPG